MRYFIEIAYNGTNYHGWQVQPNATTVQEIINDAISTILQETISVVGCGRTDTGVHASNFYAHFDTENEIKSVDEFAYRLNKFLPKDITCFKCIIVENDQHTRFDAISRTYRYYIHQNKNPFKLDSSFLFQRELDLDKMNKAAALLKNYDDFTSFAKLHGDNKTNICELFYAHWTKIEDGLIFEIKANRFLRNMVRSIVGTLLDVGQNKISIKEFTDIIELKNRSEAGVSVPGKGLFLAKIEYPYIND